jgi:pectate lyase
MTPWKHLSSLAVFTLYLGQLGLGLGKPGAVGAAPPYEGFGASTAGGAGRAVYRVTTLADSGAGSLRDAVSKGDRSIVFAVAGEIVLTSDLWVRGPFITIDGTTAPAPGITLKDRALLIHGSKGAHDVIVRGLRSRQSTGCDSCSSTGVGIGIGTEAHHVVLDQVSVQGFDDQAISVDKGARDVTIQWSLFAEGKNPSHNLPVLIAGTSKTTGAQTRRVSFHHNLIVKGHQRMPYVTLSSTGERATELQLDMRNNVIWDWVSMGTQVWRGAMANVINNYYYDPDAGDRAKHLAIYFCKAAATLYQCNGSDPRAYARAYIAGNVSGHGAGISAYLNGLGTEASPFPGAAVTTTDACTAARQVVAKAGVRPLDDVDQKYLSMVKLVGC